MVRFITSDEANHSRGVEHLFEKEMPSVFVDKIF